MSVTITLAEVQKVAAKYLGSKRRNPGWQETFTNSCTLTDPLTDKHCLVGQLLTDLGVPLPDVADPSNEWPVAAYNDVLAVKHQIHLTNEAVVFLEGAQDEADSGRYWRQALSFAWKQVEP